MIVVAELNDRRPLSDLGQPIHVVVDVADQNLPRHRHRASTARSVVGVTDRALRRLLRCEPVQAVVRKRKSGNKSLTPALKV